jgi:uncharacterized protein (DUF2147 family)
MKKHLFTAFAILFVPLFLYAQAYKIEETWFNEDKTSTIDIEKGTNGKYFGEISWMDEPNENGKPKIDDENPDPKLANQPLMGLTIVKNFKYNSKKKRWDNGTIYDPDNGKTYDCYAWFEDGNFNTLYLKGYVAGIKVLGRKTVWKRK